jgi:hypothetical protein
MYFHTWAGTPYPAQYSDETIWVALSRDAAGAQGIANVPVHTVWNYRTTTSYLDWHTGNDGKAAMIRNISDATCGYTVRVDIYVDYDQHQIDSAYFTPCGNSAYSGGSSYTPPASYLTADFSPPKFTSIPVVSATTPTSFTVTWTTNEPASSEVKNGISANYDSIADRQRWDFTLDHSVTIDGLTPGMTYHYRVQSRDPSGNLTVDDQDRTVTLSATGSSSSPAPAYAPPPASASVYNPPTVAGGSVPGSGYSCPAGYPIKGNLTTYNGDRIYHVPGGQYYDSTKPEQCFATEVDALAAGYRRSKV